VDIKKEFSRIESEFKNDKKGTDYYKFVFVEQLTDPLDLCRVILEWSDCFGDDYYSGCHGAIISASENLLKNQPR
jgi:hypothetical protein